MKLQLSPRARQDITDIGRYIRERNPRAALVVRDEIKASLNLLATHAHAGRAIGDTGLHRFVVPRLPYLIFYRVDEIAGAIQIVTIRHAARRELI